MALAAAVVVVVVVAVLFLQQQTSHALPAVCEDCWCIPDDGAGGTCPPVILGLYEHIPESTWRAYVSFELVGDSQAIYREGLKTASGASNCYPFRKQQQQQQGADKDLGPYNNYPESQDPPCVPAIDRVIRSTSSELALPITSRADDVVSDVVCAYKYFNTDDSDGSSSSICCQRQYEMHTYETALAAFLDGADIVHKGACGYCSSAHDVGIRMRAQNNVGSETAIGFQCTFDYLTASPGDELETRFQKLIACYQDAQSYGFTYPCSQLWAHYTATASEECRAECGGLLDQEEVIDRGPCVPEKCIRCIQERVDPPFIDMIGFHPPRGGLIDASYQCSDIYPVVHEPCGAFHHNNIFDDEGAGGRPEHCSIDHLTNAPTPFVTSAPIVPTTPSPTLARTVRPTPAPQRVTSFTAPTEVPAMTTTTLEPITASTTTAMPSGGAHGPAAAAYEWYGMGTITIILLWSWH